MGAGGGLGEPAGADAAAGRKSEPYEGNAPPEYDVDDAAGDGAKPAFVVDGAFIIGDAA